MKVKESFFDKFLIRDKIYLALVLVIFSLTTIFGILTFLYFQLISKSYHENRLAKKEKTIIETVDYLISEYPQRVTPDNVANVFLDNIYKYSDINDIHINIYSLRGKLLVSSQLVASEELMEVPEKVMEVLSPNNDRVEMRQEVGANTYIRIYSYLYNLDNQPVAIINLPYLHDDSYQKDEFYNLLKKILFIGVVIMLVGLVISYWLSKGIASRLDKIAQKLIKTDVVGVNRPLQYYGRDEIRPLVDSYNRMLVKLDEQSAHLVKLEREETWREAARQVAHELKNPLTPMRLQMQNFQRKFDREDPDLEGKVNDLTKSIIHQIDLIDRIVQAFADYTKMPVRKDQEIDICDEIDKILEMFDDNVVKFERSCDKIIIYYDPIYLTRIITNLVKNSLQAIPSGRKPEIKIKIKLEKKFVFLEVIDNGVGINGEVKDKLFQPKFTTKSSGSGLGLPMVKKMVEEYNGSIDFRNNEREGVTFTITLPRKIEN